MAEGMVVTKEGAQAARAVAQWKLGNPDWARMLIGLAVLPGDQAKKAAEYYFREFPGDFEEVWDANA